jgi:hypothetical protein
MADVLESQYAVLLKKVDTSKNFEELRHAHDVFLSSVTAHTFIDNKPVSWIVVLNKASNFHYFDNTTWKDLVTIPKPSIQIPEPLALRKKFVSIT